jgi:nucleotide-binding universal stress UspA family protein
MLGTIASNIVGLVSIPVWIVGGNAQPKKVLACLDNSDCAMAALNHLSRTLDVSKNIEITLFHAVSGFSGFRNLVRQVFASAGDQAAVENIERELRESAKLMEPSFDKARAILISNGVDPTAIHEKVASGAVSPAQGIIDEAEQGGYDTIITGRKGLAKTSEYLMGRVSSKVVHLAKDKTVWVVC